MKIGDYVYLLVGAGQGQAGIVCSFGPPSDPEPWAVVRVLSLDACLRVPLMNLSVIPNYPIPVAPVGGHEPLSELPSSWAAALV